MHLLIWLIVIGVECVAMFFVRDFATFSGFFLFFSFLVFVGSEEKKWCIQLQIYYGNCHKIILHKLSVYLRLLQCYLQPFYFSKHKETK